MPRFFSPAEDNRFSGSVTYLESLQRLFAQDEGSGLIELQAGEERTVILLLNAGRSVGSFLVENETVQRFELVNLARIWSGTTSPIRYMQLPAQAVRAAWQALEWNAGRQALPADLSPVEIIDMVRVQKADGMLHLALRDLDGFTMLVDGIPLSSETILATPRGFEESLPNFRLTPGAPGSMQASLYPIQAGTLSGDIALLRLGADSWCSGIIASYQQLVGQSLINALNYDLNTQLRLKRLNLRLVGTRLVDHQLFTNLDSATSSYRLVVQRLVDHTARVVGTGLIRRALGESYQRLKEPERRLLSTRGLAPENFS